MVSTLYLAKVLLTRPLPFVKYQLVVTFYFPNIHRLKETATERKSQMANSCKTCTSTYCYIYILSHHYEVLGLCDQVKT